MPRLDRLLVRNLACPRGEVRRLLAEGAVRDAAGAVLAEPRLEIPAPLDVTVDGEPLRLEDTVHLALHKPQGIVTALRDERHPTAYALLRDAPLWAELRPAGRLDLETTGLLLWTTDGTWLHRLTHPKRAVPRTYQAALARPFHPPPPDFALEDGHRPHIVELRRMASAERHPCLLAPEAPTLATITIVGGAYHEVRRIFAALGSHVLALARTRFGALSLPVDLPPGAWRRIEPAEVEGERISAP